jgi:hypothetical protein
MLFTSEIMKLVEYVAYIRLMRNASNGRQFSQSNPHNLYPPSLTSSCKIFYKIRKKAPIGFASLCDCLAAPIKPASTGRISVISDIGDLFEYQ